jgi:hypothetical protein
MTLYLTPDQLKAFTPISNSIEVETLYPFLSTVQSMYVVPILGLALSSQLETQVSGGTVSGANQTLLWNYIMPYMAWKTFEQAIPFLGIKAYKRSLVKPAGVDTTALTLDEVKFYRQNVSDIANHYGQSMIDMLQADEMQNNPQYPLYRIQGQNEQRTQASQSNGMYFRKKLNSGSYANWQSYPDNWMWNGSYWMFPVG